MKPIRWKKTLFNRFMGDERASLSVEAVLVMPFMLWAFGAMYAFFDVYHMRSLAMKGNYAVADLLSRETNALDMDYVLGTEDVFEYLTEAGDSAWIRITPVRCDENCDNEATRELGRDWSRATDGVARLSDSDVNTDYRDVIPMIAEGERVIMLETQLDYTPPLAASLTGVGARQIYDITMTRPRFGPQLCWEGRSCSNDD